MAQFTYPTEDYSVRSEGSELLWMKQQSLKALTDDLAAARKAAKRSPRKWTPVIAEKTAAVEALLPKIEALQAKVEAEYQARREARAAVLREAATWALSQIGPVHEINHVLALRVRDEAAGHDLLVYGSGRELNFDIAYVKAGTDEIVERLGYIYGPEEKWSRVSEPGTITKTRVSTSSASNMTADDLLAFATALRVVSLVASKLDEAFGL